MDKRLVGLLAALASMVSGIPKATADQAGNDLGDWASLEGYRWAKVDGEIVFCRSEIATGSHIPMSNCVDYQNLVDRWEQWKKVTTIRRPLPGALPSRAPVI